MPSRAEVVAFYDPPVPAGCSPWVPGAEPGREIEIVEPDAAWPTRYDELATRICNALGWRALVVEHVGSTSVPGLPAKPIIDIDLIVADPDNESVYVPALEAAGFQLRVREPWWFSHRMFRFNQPACNLHVFGFDSPEPIKHLIFRDWLRANHPDREIYAEAKRQAARISQAQGEHAMQYNARKEEVIRQIYGRAFEAMGLLD
jgi:GrpB-like predicted nucleotidyltransferase (UPF0157 family)